MRRWIHAALALVLTASLAACAATAEERTGESEGYGGALKVMVTLDGGRLQSVQVTEHHETEGVGTRAIDALPSRMASAGTWDVETVSGATVTSNALKAAVRNALGEGAASPSAALPQATATATAAVQPATSAMSGVGMSALGRVGPGKAADDSQVYSFNVVFAQASFAADGRVLSAHIDQLEIFSGNTQSADVPKFSGFPGDGSQTEEAFLAEVAAWSTKRARGDAYKLTAGSWREQMDAYERHFTGKTVDEIEAWFGKLFSDDTGRPLAEGSEAEADRAKYDALTDDEKRLVKDVTSMATMSLKDSHGDILLALRRAWEDAQRRR